MINGKFTDRDGNEYQYRVTDWFTQNHQKRKATYYGPEHFRKTDRIWVETRDEFGNTRYTTVMGPFENRQFIVDILTYDYNEYLTTSAA